MCGNILTCLHAGQITGFAGLVGAGRTETMRAIFGADKLDSGEVYVKGEKVHIRSPKDAIRHKIAFLTEDRKGQGLVLSLDVRTNLILANMVAVQLEPLPTMTGTRPFTTRMVCSATAASSAWPPSAGKWSSADGGRSR